MILARIGKSTFIIHQLTEEAYYKDYQYGYSRIWIK